MSARGLERIGDVFSSIGMMQQIYYGMKFDGGDGMKFDSRPQLRTTATDTHNNQPKTARRKWRIEGRGGAAIGEVKVCRLVTI